MSFLAKLEEDLKLAREAHAHGRFREGLVITERYVGPTSRSREFLGIHAQLLQAFYQFEEADPYLERLIELDPTNAFVLMQRIDGLRFTGRVELAAKLLAEGRPKFPDHGGLLGVQLCQLLTAEGPQAALAALAAEEKSPARCKNINIAIEDLRQKLLALHDPSEILAFDKDNLLGLRGGNTSDLYNMREIYEQFESLGADCDFGSIQRLRQAEPLSLLRWTSVTPANLVRLLRDNLVGYDDPSHYIMRGVHTKEFILYEDVYETASHTGVNISDIGKDEFLERLTRRQTFLTRKFIADLAAGKKTFLYKAKAAMTEAEIEAIDCELARLGARRRVFTMPTDDTAKAATIAFPTPGRAVAYLSPKPASEIMSEWDRVVVAAYDHFQRTAPQPA